LDCKYFSSGFTHHPPIQKQRKLLRRNIRAIREIGTQVGDRRSAVVDTDDFWGRLGGRIAA